MTNDLIYRKEWIELKATLQFVEGKILRIIDINGWMSHKDLEEQVKELLSDRHVILNKMFRMHVTRQEVARFREVNDQLLTLTRRMYSELRAMAEAPYVVSLDDKGFVEIESKLDVDDGGEVLQFTDDNDYGSNFAQMIDAIAWTEDLEIRSCNTYMGEKPESDHLDDGTTWAEGCLDIPQFKDIVVCYAVHDLCTHKNYSIPDLLRLQSYTIRHNIDVVRKNTISSGVLSVISRQ